MPSDVSQLLERRNDVRTRPGEIGARYHRIVELRYQVGSTIEETAEVLNVSRATLEREWNFARTWLRRELQPGRGVPR